MNTNEPIAVNFDSDNHDWPKVRYYDLNRKLKDRDIEEIRIRKDNREKLVDILSDMNVLK